MIDHNWLIGGAGAFGQWPVIVAANKDGTRNQPAGCPHSAMPLTGLKAMVAGPNLPLVQLISASTAQKWSFGRRTLEYRPQPD